MRSKTNIGIFIAAAVVLAVLSLTFWTVTRRTDIELLPESAVRSFCGHIFKAISEPAARDVSVKQAIALLSVPAKADIAKMSKGEKQKDLMDELIWFSGLGIVPDGKVVIDITVQSEDAAMVKTTMSFSGKTVSKAFYLKKEKSGWRIDSIKSWQQL
jgi:hypothetical protein